MTTLITTAAARREKCMLHLKEEKNYDYRIIQLIYSCPLNQKKRNCPFRKIRTKDFNKKIKWLKSLSLATKKSIYQYHLICYLKSISTTGELFLNMSQEKKIEITVSNKTKSMASKCKKKSSCLDKTEREICEVKKCLLESALYVKFNKKEPCNYHYSVGGDSFCGCPVRKEIFKKYSI
jgi:CRISPR/Cas system CSM-associated protein Csm5 (group 7 of RAMP superfamily)